MILQREDAKAEVIETYDARTIKIRISGKNGREFMTIIINQLDNINQQYKKLEVEKFVPRKCIECKLQQSPYFHEYKDLKRRLEKGKLQVECKKSYLLVDVMGLLENTINIRKDYLDEQQLKRDKIFISYCHQDKPMLERVQTHLKVLKNQGFTLSIWSDLNIKAGMI